MRHLRRLLEKLRGPKFLLFENKLWREGMKIYATTDYNNGLSSIIGELIFKKDNWFIKGQIIADTSDREREVEVYECWAMRRL